MYKRILFSLIIVFITLQTGFSQRFLVLEKMGTKKRFEYHVGDRISFKLEGDKKYRKIVIDAIGDSTLVLNGDIYAYDQIKRVNLSQFKGAWLGFGSTLVLAGVLYFTIDQINQRAISGNKNPGVDQGVAIGSGLLVGSGATMIIFSRKTVKVRNNWRLRVVEIY